MREALFMSLGRLEGMRVVDLYAGSGALGIEALSRGARRVDFADIDRAALKVLEQNLTTVEALDRTTTWRLELPRDLRQMSHVLGEAGLILLDPPYGGEEARAALKALGRAALRDGVRVVVEHHRKDGLPEVTGSLVRVREQRYGETCVTTYRESTDDTPARRRDGNEP